MLFMFCIFSLFSGLMTTPLEGQQSQPFEISLPLVATIDQLLMLTLGLVLALGVLRVFLLGFQTNLATKIGVNIGSAVYFKTISKDYSVVAQSSSATFVSLLEKARNLVTDLIFPLISIFVGSVTVLAVFTMIVFISARTAVYVLTFLCILYSIFYFTSQRKVRDIAITIAEKTTVTTALVQEGWGSLRQIKLSGLESSFSSYFETHLRALQSSKLRLVFLGLIPRYLIETLGLTVIIVLIFIFTSDADKLVVAEISAIGVGGLRLLPMFQQVYTSTVTLRGGARNIQDVQAALAADVPRLTKAPSGIPFEEAVVLKNISFSYPGYTERVFDSANLMIERGKFYGLCGDSGAGKSTLVDIISGLLEPTSGELHIDDVRLNYSEIANWQRNIGYVPQRVYLRNQTAREIVAFGEELEDIDTQRVWKCLDAAQLSSFFTDKDEGLAFVVGENGSMMSGGQRQRLAIAQALYRHPKILILDEATNALDERSETGLLSALRDRSDFDVTAIIISHDSKTLKNLDGYFVLKERKIIATKVLPDLSAL
jgi:ATP-binding cassette subfamily B protein